MDGPSKLQLQRFRDAECYPSTGLTYSALTGQCVQSVGDMQQFLTPLLLSLWVTRMRFAVCATTGGVQLMNVASHNSKDVISE